VIKKRYRGGVIKQRGMAGNRSYHALGDKKRKRKSSTEIRLPKRKMEKESIRGRKGQGGSSEVREYFRQAKTKEPETG